MKFDITKLSAEFNRIQNELTEILNKIRVESSVGGGMVKAVADGNGNIISLTIEPELIKEENFDIEMLQDLIVAAVNDAKNLAKNEAREKIQQLIGLPLKGILPDNLL